MRIACSLRTYERISNDKEFDPGAIKLAVTKLTSRSIDLVGTVHGSAIKLLSLKLGGDENTHHAALDITHRRQTALCRDI
jgi:hypothetical protein